MGGTAERRRDVERPEHGLDGGLPGEVAALDDPPHPPPLVGEPPGGRQVHPRDLEQRDAVVPGVHVVPRRRDEPVEQRCPEDRVLCREGLGEPQRARVGVGRDEAPGVCLVHPLPHEDVLHVSAKALLLGQAPEHLPSGRERERHSLEPVDARDLLHQVDLAHDVPRAPGWRGHAPRLDGVVHVEAEAPEDRGLLARRHGDPDDLLRPRGAERRDRPRGKLGSDVRVAGVRAAREVDQELARQHGRLLARHGVDALLPAVRGLATEAQPLRAREDAVRLEVRCLEEHVDRRVGDLGRRARP